MNIRIVKLAAIVAGIVGLGLTPTAADPLVIDGATVHPVSGPPFVGRVVAVDGRIVAVGPAVVAPAGAEWLDATGLHVYPGLFDALSQLGLLEIGSISATDDRAELGAFNPHLRALTAIHPASAVLPVTRANGITHSLVAPRTDRDGVVSGQASLVQLDGWTVEEMAIEPALAMVIDWPAIATRRFDFATFSVKETPFSEAKETAEKQQNKLRDWLDAARQYALATATPASRSARDLKLEALARVLDGGMRVVIRAETKRDIEAAVAFAEEQGLRMILAGGRDAWKVKELLAEKAIPVILGLPQSLPPEEDDPYDRAARTAGELEAAGVQIAFGSGAGGGFGPGGPHSSRTLPYEAAAAVAGGLPAEEALIALTLAPAEMLGIADQLGSIEVGKRANLIVTDGDPLEITTRVVALVIGGRQVSTDNRQEQLYRTYRAR